MSTGRFYMPSSFHKDGAIRLVKFGEGGPVLETELNELQETQNDLRKQYFTALVNDGVITEPTNISYLNGTLTITGGKFILKGEIIPITTISLALAEGQKAYLKIWEEEINHTQAIKKFGNIQETNNVTNKMFDSRPNKETTRRVQLKYSMVSSVTTGETYLELGSITGGTFTKSYPKAKFTIEALVDESDLQNMNAHIQDTTIHVTTTEKNTWNAKETPEGAQAKVNTHANDKNNPHATTASQVGAYTKTEVDNLIAQAGQNAFSIIKVGATNVTADQKTDTLELVAGTNVVITPDATNDKITIGLSSEVETKSGAQAKADAVQTNLTNHIGTGGTAHAVATTSQNGFMSSGMVTKLNGIAEGAEVNQNAFSHVKVGATTVSADSKTDTLELVAGSDIDLTPDATNDKVTIGLSNTHKTSSAPHQYGGKFEWRYNSTSDTLDLVVVG